MNLVNGVLPHNFGVYAVDLRGNGESDGQRGHINAWADYRDDIHMFLTAVVHQHKDVPVFLLGHSMGGLAVMDYIIHHPDAPIHGLIVSSPLLSDPDVSQFLLFLLPRIAKLMPKFSLNPGVDWTTVSRDSEWVEFVRNDPHTHERTTPRTGTELVKTRDAVLENLNWITLPFLLVYGSADRLVPPEMTRDMFEQVASADKTQFEYESSYHEVHNDLDKERLLNDLCAWIIARL